MCQGDAPYAISDRTRIEDVRITPVAFRDPPLLAASGMHEPWATRSILEIVCENGIVGLSETYGDAATIHDLRAIAPALVGLRATQTRSLHELVCAHVGDTSVDAYQASVTSPRTDPNLRVARIFAAFEVGMLDASARAIGVPLCELLGGPYRSCVPFGGYLFFKAGGHPGLDNADDWGEVLSPDGSGRDVCDV